ncbi:3561_t:CDS:2 [Funneliformis caledonium]|uniref:THO complex subunit 2 n=1 Tax=Funneliformis caledonium TaxID=1117310 RepID=A0A9N8ZCN3_9GLOM|nr:3561_t:CDS:2 [Funneliformis caledonium]
MEDTLYQGINQVVQGKKPLNILDQLFSNPQSLSETDKDIILDTIWYIESTFQDENNEYRTRLASIVKYIFSKKIIDIKLFKTRLEVSLLGAAGLVDEKLFNRRLVRINTAMLYKQQKYNLLREENEGYAKLICELAQHCDPDYIVETEAALNERANSLLEQIKMLIGYFHLDPNRVLDLILDVFVVNVREHHEFFLRLLEISPWQPEPPPNSNKMDVDDQLFMWENDLGNPSCAQLLGTKYQRYEGDNMLSNVFGSLYEVSALLIHRGLVSVGDLHPHIMIDEITEEMEWKKKLEVQHRHELGLACALLSIGDLYHARYYIYQLPYIHPNIAKKVCEILHISIEPIYFSIAPNILEARKPPAFPGSWYLRWKDGIPMFKTMDELILEGGRELLNLVSPFFNDDIILFTKILRLALRHLTISRSAPNIHQIETSWLDIVRSVILPSISMCETNPGVITDFWDVLCHYPYETRYGIYGEWKCESYNIHPILRDLKTNIIKQARGIMKRITDDNYRQKGREISKLATGNPAIVYSIALDQVQRYPNMITPVVEACRYLSDFAYDVLSYLMLEILASDKPRIKEDGINMVDWLQNISLFCGQICRKYEPIDLRSILQYVVNQLQLDNEVDLCVLSQLITNLSGIELSVIPSESDVVLMSGSDTLRKTRLYNININKNVRRSSARLAKTIIDTGFLTPLAFYIAQMCQKIPFPVSNENNILSISTSSDLKQLGAKLDTVRNTYVQYMEFLALNVDMKDHHRMIPDTIELCNKYAVQPEYAFMLLRPKLNYLIKSYYETTMDAEEDNIIWQPALRDVIEQAQQIYPSHVWNGISPEFYTTFWQLSLYDLQFPAQEYQKAINETRSLLKTAEDKKRPQDIKKYTAILNALEEEYKQHPEHTTRIRQRLMREKDHWFSGQFSNRQDIITQFWQYCLFPRLIMSADNAVFCAKFIEEMHEIGTANFSTLTLYDRVFADQAQPVTFTCTEAEARNYGRFLQTCLKSLSVLHKDSNAYEERGKGRGIPGFQMKWSALNRQPSSIAETDLLQYEDFRRVYYKWHSKLLKAFEQGLLGIEYISVRNTIIVLSEIVLYFPAIETMGKKVESFVKNIADNEKRSDIKVLALSYLGKLRSMRKTWIPYKQFQTPKQQTPSNAQNPTSTQNASTPTNNTSTVQQNKATIQPERPSTPQPYRGNLSNVRDGHQSPRATARTNSPRRQIHPLPDKPMEIRNPMDVRNQLREKEREKERERERERNKEKKIDIHNEREKEKMIKKIDHEREREIKKIEHHERDKIGRDVRERNKIPEIPRGEIEKKDIRKPSKERQPGDDRMKRIEHHPRSKERELRDREERMKEKEREKREERREDKREERREEKHVILMMFQDGFGKKRDRTDRDRDEEPEISKKRVVERAGERIVERIPPEIIPPISRPPVKLNRTTEHISELLVNGGHYNPGMSKKPGGGDKHRRRNY